jgi:hypothetical protein
VCLFIHSPGDAFFKAAINSVKDVPQFMELDRKRQSTERFMMEYFNSFLSTLLTVPDNPDQQVLYLIRGLLNGLDEYQWYCYHHNLLTECDILTITPSQSVISSL